ncbi:helix-turn-helix transcriptional regulator [Megamonas funiformis]|uniref:helix-turn-helix transcriptional regulator n=1 Tax=Megamonas funiformis TaxID=437897 RepID=UPI002941E9BD|nr:helix-turn-helix transcriptional regulator [Megamonas funiformis]
MKITIKAARVNKNLSQKEAASLIGVSKDTIGAWDRGKSMPNAKYIPAIEKVYGVSYKDLIFLHTKDA